MALDVKFKQGQYANLPTSLDANTLYFANDKAVMGAAGKLYYGQPTIEYTNDTIVLYGVSGDTSTKLGEVNLSLDSFLEDATYIAGKGGEGYTPEGAAYTWAHGVATAITQEQVTAAYNSAFGETFVGDKSAIVMVMHTEKTTDEHSLVVIPVGKLMGDVQGEVDKIETAVGLNQDGTYSKTTGSTTSAATSVKGAIEALDTKAVELQSELDATQKGAGLNADGTYSANTDAHTISDATSLKDADDKLDAMIGAKSTGTTIAAETLWAAIEEAAAEKTVVSGNGDNKNLTVTSADTDGKVTYTVNETGLTPSANGVAITSSNTVAANLTALDNEIKKQTLSAGTVNGVDVVIEHDDNDSTSFSVEISGTNITVGDDIVSAESATFISASAKIDDALQSIVDEIIANEEVEAAAISAFKETLGVTGETIAYEKNTGVTYINDAESFNDADVKLDKAIKNLADKVLTSTGDTIAITTASSKTNIDVKYDTKSIEQTANGNLKVKVDNSAVSETAGGIKINDDNANGLTATLYWGSF